MYDQEHYKELEFTLNFQPIDLCAECGFVLGNALKYILRAGHKDRYVDDLVKARDYLIFLREDLEKNFKNLELKLSARAVLTAMHYCEQNQLVSTLFANYTMPRDWYDAPRIVIELQDVKTCIHDITEMLED